jgi:hypothetical protein
VNEAAAPAVRSHRRLSPKRIATLAANALTQLLRMRTLYFLIAFGAVLVVFGFIMPAPPSGMGLEAFGGEQELRLLKSVSLGAMSWFCVILAIAGTALLLPADLEDRTLYTILSKPVPRFDYLTGKLAGVILLIALSLALMDAGCCGALWLKQRVVTAETITHWQQLGELTPERIAEIQREYAAHGINWNFHSAVFGILCQAIVMAAVCLLISTFASSSLFTILAGLAVFIIGQGQELAREFIFSGVGGALGRLFSTTVALTFPDLRQFNVIDEVVAGKLIPAAVSGRMAVMALVYTAFYHALGWFIFKDKEL